MCRRIVLWPSETACIDVEIGILCQESFLECVVDCIGNNSLGYILPSNQTNYSAYYWLEFNKLRSSLAAKKPNIVDRNSIFPHHDNVRPHAAVIASKIWSLFGFTSSTFWFGTYWLSRVLSILELEQFFQQKSVWRSWWCEVVNKVYFNSKPWEFCWRRIYLPPERCQ